LAAARGTALPTHDHAEGSKVAEAFYGGVPEELPAPTLGLLDSLLVAIVIIFLERFRPEEAERVEGMLAP